MKPLTAGDDNGRSHRDYFFPRTIGKPGANTKKTYYADNGLTHYSDNGMFLYAVVGLFRERRIE
jgi:hypothetical protein